MHKLPKDICFLPVFTHGRFLPAIGQVGFIQLERMPVQKGELTAWLCSLLDMDTDFFWATLLGYSCLCGSRQQLHAMAQLLPDNLAQSVEKSSVQCKLQEKFRQKIITRVDI